MLCTIPFQKAGDQSSNYDLFFSLFVFFGGGGT
uniref:Uncharacterized protein n=1 Tax=Rhizophora mucronata TaxID=61149 RepID=A0A2P2QLC6_RHIMU